MDRPIFYLTKPTTMKKLYFFLSLILLILFSEFSWGQIKLGSNPSTIDPAALLELESSTQGLLLPRMTSAQRDALPVDSSPVGLLIYNTDINEIQYLYKATMTNAKGEKRQELRWESATDDTIPLGRPTNPVTGQLFYDVDMGQLNLWDGSQWVAVGGSTNSGGATSTISFQNLTLTGTQLSISNGNTVDLSTLVTTTTGPVGSQGPVGPQGPAGPQGNPATDDQTLAVSALSANNTLTITISGGNTETLDLSSLATTGVGTQSIAELAFDSKTNSLTVGITNGASETVDLSNLNQNIAALAFDSSTNSLTVGITDGVSQTISLATLGSTTVSGSLTIKSGTSSYTLPTAIGGVGQVLAIENASSGTMTWTSISGSGVFTSNTNTLFSSIGTTTHDFIRGSDQIDNITGGDDDARRYFDKSKAAFRAGHASGTTWNDAMVGNRSATFGFNTEASGDRSTAFGNATEAFSYAEITLGSYNTTTTPLSKTTWNTNDRLFVIGNGNSSANRSNALVMLKNGNTTLNGQLTLNPTGTSSYTLPTHKGTSGQVLTIDNATSGTTTWTSTSGLGNLATSLVSTNTTLNNDIQFVVITGTATVTFPATPSEGQILYIYRDGSGFLTIIPNGNPLRSGGADFSGPTPYTGAGTLIYAANRWYLIN